MVTDGSSAPGVILVDAHVHFYRCFDAPGFLAAASANFSLEARRRGWDNFSALLLLAETSNDRWFERLASRRVKGSTGGWTFRRTEEADSLIAEADGCRSLTLIAGRQIVTAERLEVLALATPEYFADGGAVVPVLKMVKDRGALPVLPWGAGKWLGQRGKLVREALQHAPPSPLFCGDSSQRPVVWPRPRMFSLADRLGIKVLAGSDPLPLPPEAARAGSFGFSMAGAISPKRPARDVRRLLSDRATALTPYGRLERPFRFFSNQLRIRLGWTGRDEDPVEESRG